MRKLNCWEFKKCGREKAGQDRKRRICPTVITSALNGVHGGEQGGRSCWVVEGTLCGGKSRSLSDKFRTCCDCEFYRMVMREEGATFVLSSALRTKANIGQATARESVCRDVEA